MVQLVEKVSANPCMKRTVNTVYRSPLAKHTTEEEKSRIRETLTLSTCADSSTDTFFFRGEGSKFTFFGEASKEYIFLCGEG